MQMEGQLRRSFLCLVIADVDGPVAMHAFGHVGIAQSKLVMGEEGRSSGDHTSK